MKNRSLSLALFLFALAGLAFCYQRTGRLNSFPSSGPQIPAPPNFVPLETNMVLTPFVPIGRSGALSATFAKFFAPVQGLITFEFGKEMRSESVGGLAVDFTASKTQASYSVVFTVEIDYFNDPQGVHNFELGNGRTFTFIPMKGGRQKAFIRLPGGGGGRVRAELRCVGADVKWRVVSVVIERIGSTSTLSKGGG